MDIDGLNSFRPGDPGEDGEFFGEDAREVGAGTAAFGLLGGFIAGVTVAASIVPIVAGVTVGGGLYASGCAAKWLYHKITD